MKFGGGLLTSGRRIRESAQLAKDQMDRGNEVIVVTSALGGVTDRLLSMIGQLEGEPPEPCAIECFCRDLLALHLEAAECVVGPEGRAKISSKLEALVCLAGQELSNLAGGSVPARDRDSIISVGERLSTLVFAAVLSSLGTPSLALDGGEAGLVTDSHFGEAMPNMEICRERAASRLGDLLARGLVPVVAGFIAEDESGGITTLGRGGSDYTASILASCLEADEIWIWKDVGGIMTADPKLVPEAGTIPVLSYAEAAELAYFGAKVLHPRTMAPAMQEGIPIRVKDAASPASPGTLISDRTSEAADSVKAVTRADHVGMIAVSGTGMVGVPGVAARIFDALARAEVNVMMISQSSSETNITIVIPGKDIPLCRRVLGSEFEGDQAVKEVRFDEEISIVSVVGAGMKGTPGAAAKVFRAVADGGINVMMIAQGSSELNISFVVRRGDSAAAVSAIHREFGLGRTSRQGLSRS